MSSILFLKKAIGPAVLQAGAKNLKLFRGVEDPAKWLDKDLELEWAEPDVLRIALRGGQASELAKGVDAVSDAFIRLVVDSPRRQYEDTLKGKKEILKRIEQGIRKPEKAGPTLLPGYTPEEKTIHRNLETGPRSASGRSCHAPSRD